MTVIKKYAKIRRYLFNCIRMSMIHNPESDRSYEIEGYGKALARIKSRVSEKHILYPLVEKYFQDKSLVVIIGSSKADKIYGNNIGLLLSLFGFLSSAREYAPSMIKKISDLKDFYGDDEKLFKRLTLMLRPAILGFEISSLDLALSSSEEDMQSAQKVKEDILIAIGKLKQDLQKVAKKSKNKGHGQPNMNLKKYEDEIQMAISAYLGFQHAINEKELYAIITKRRDSKETSDGEVLQIRETTRHRKDETIGKTM